LRPLPSLLHPRACPIPGRHGDGGCQGCGQGVPHRAWDRPRGKLCCAVLSFSHTHTRTRKHMHAHATSKLAVSRTTSYACTHTHTRMSSRSQGKVIKGGGGFKVGQSVVLTGQYMGYRCSTTYYPLPCSLHARLSPFRQHIDGGFASHTLASPFRQHMDLLSSSPHTRLHLPPDSTWMAGSPRCVACPPSGLWRCPRP
jgi:hypothetical protein